MIDVLGILIVIGVVYGLYRLGKYAGSKNKGDAVGTLGTGGPGNDFDRHED